MRNVTILFPSGMNSVLKEGVYLDAKNGPITIGKGCIGEHHARIHSSAGGILIGAGTLIGADACLNAGNGGLTSVFQWEMMYGSGHNV